MTVNNAPKASKCLIASYASHSASQTFSKGLPALSDPSNKADKTTYLSTLRSGISHMQSDVNVFLTKKMEADRAANLNQGNQETSRDEKEEEMYGEEDPDLDG